MFIPAFTIKNPLLSAFYEYYKRTTLKYVMPVLASLLPYLERSVIVTNSLSFPAAEYRLVAVICDNSIGLNWLD